jgi:hypothetical protein
MLFRLIICSAVMVTMRCDLDLARRYCTTQVDVYRALALMGGGPTLPH